MATQTTDTHGVTALHDGDLDERITNEDLVLVEFRTEWCGACQQMEPTLETLAAETAAAVLTVDIESHLDTAIEFGAQSTPTFVLFADGRPVKQLRGAQSEQTLRDLITRYDE